MCEADLLTIKDFASEAFARFRSIECFSMRIRALSLDFSSTIRDTVEILPSRTNS
jgi:hypothetical protein